jgi:enterochelin esterase-like enzyme
MPTWDSFHAFLAAARRTDDEAARQQLVDELLLNRPAWPWIEGNRATFVFSKLGAHNVALNMDIIKADPPFAPMTNLQGTTLWYITLDFAADDLLDYMLAIDDPMTPLAAEKDIVGRVALHWRTDRLNPLTMHTAQMDVSVLRMSAARPFPDWAAMPHIPRGQVHEHTIDSPQLGFTGRKLWVYTPPGYENSGMVYPLLILHEGQWAAGPLQVPYIADALIKHQRMQPVVIAMEQSGSQENRIRDYVSNDRHYAHTLLELLPFVQTQYRIDSTHLGVGGVGVGAIGAAHAALKNPAVFTGLIMISPPLGKGVAEEQLAQYAARFRDAALLPRHIFQSVGRYEIRSRFYRPAQVLREVLEPRQDIYYQFAEIGSGHGLVAFKSVFPEALAWVFPGEAFVG